MEIVVLDWGGGRRGGTRARMGHGGQGQLRVTRRIGLILPGAKGKTNCINGIDDAAQKVVGRLENGSGQLGDGK